MQPVLLGRSLAGNLVKPLMSLYGTERRERGYGLCSEVFLDEDRKTMKNGGGGDVVQAVWP
jgi:hypothetical protein